MVFTVIYKPATQIEVTQAYHWYNQPDIGMGQAFLAELERANGFLEMNPYLYPRIESELRKTNLNRFPYSLYFLIDGDTVYVLSCFHQHRDPKSIVHLFDTTQNLPKHSNI